MKKIVAICLILSACKKEVDPVSTVTIKVRDAASNTAVSGAYVQLLKCDNPIDLLCWFNSLIPFAMNTSDASGACNFSQTDFKRSLGIRVLKSGYWTKSNDRDSTRTIYVYPEGWIRVRVVRVNNYPAGARMNIGISGPPGIISSGINFDAPRDSLVVIKGFGGILNDVGWTVYNYNGTMPAISGTWQQQIPRFDVANATLSY